jgi:hypothetical protein
MDMTKKNKAKSQKCKIAELGAICYNEAMKAVELAQRIGAQVLNPAIQDSQIEHVYAGDRVSDLLDHASGSTMLVSNLTSGQLIRIAELMEVAGICLVNGHRPCEEDLKMMAEHGVAVLVSPVGLFETCGRVYKCLFEKNAERRTQNKK